MSKREDKIFDNFFQEKLENLHSSPPDNAWDQVQANIHQIEQQTFDEKLHQTVKNYESTTPKQLGKNILLKTYLLRAKFLGFTVTNWSVALIILSSATVGVNYLIDNNDPIIIQDTISDKQKGQNSIQADDSINSKEITNRIDNEDTSLNHNDITIKKEEFLSEKNTTTTKTNIKDQSFNIKNIEPKKDAKDNENSSTVAFKSEIESNIEYPTNDSKSEKDMVPGPEPTNNNLNDIAENAPFNGTKLKNDTITDKSNSFKNNTYKTEKNESPQSAGNEENSTANNAENDAAKNQVKNGKEDSNYSAQDNEVADNENYPPVNNEKASNSGIGVNTPPDTTEQNTDENYAYNSESNTNTVVQENNDSSHTDSAVQNSIAANSNFWQGKLSVDLILSPSITSQRIKFHENDILSRNRPINRGRYNFYDQATETNFTFNFGVRANYHINDQWILGIGLHYSQFKQEFALENITAEELNITEYNPFFDILQLNSQFASLSHELSSPFPIIGPIIDFGPIGDLSINRIAETYQFQSIGIPISIQYLFGQNKLKYSLEAGIKPSFIVNSKTELLVNTNVNPSENKRFNNYHNFNNIFLSTISSIGMNYELNPKNSILLFTSFQYSLSNINTYQSNRLNPLETNLSLIWRKFI